MKQKLPYILEILWFAVLIVSLAAAINQTIQKGFSESLTLYLIAFLATLMFSSRRYLRKTRDRIQNGKK